MMPNQKNIMTRYSFIILMMVLIGIAIICKAGVIMFAERQYWKDVADRFVKENVTVRPTRGNIISSDGQLMASSLPEYKIYMDFKAGGHLKDSLLNKQNKKTTLKTIAAENTSAWINGHLYFDEENMETIALALERAFDVNITIKDETLKKMIFYGDFIIESNNIDEIMNIMAATNKFNYHYKIRKNEIEIFQ